MDVGYPSQALSVRRSSNPAVAESAKPKPVGERLAIWRLYRVTSVRIGDVHVSLFESINSVGLVTSSLMTVTTS